MNFILKNINSFFLLKMYVYLNAENKESGDNNNCVIPIKTFIPQGHLSLLSARVPMTYYNITTVNNVFKIDITTYTVPAGNYSLTELISAVVSLSGRTVVYDSVSGRITISGAPIFNLDFTATNSIAPVLGFDSVIYSGAFSYTSVRPPKIFDNYIFCNISEIGTGCISSSNFNITFPLPVANKDEIIEFNKNTHYDLKYKIKYPASSFNVSFRDEANNLLQNCGSFSLLLQVHC